MSIIVWLRFVKLEMMICIIQFYLLNLIGFDYGDKCLLFYRKAAF